MPTANDILVHSLTVSLQLLEMYVSDLTPAEFLHRPVPGSNCAAWILGHLIVVERGALMAMGVIDFPALPEGFEQRFSTKGDAPRATEFDDTTALMPLFKKLRGLTIEAARRASAEQLDRPLEKPHPRFKTVAQRVNGAAHHAVMHAGQITLIRRSLGRPPIG